MSPFTSSSTGFPHLWEFISPACPMSASESLSKWTCPKTPETSWPDLHDCLLSTWSSGSALISDVLPLHHVSAAEPSHHLWQRLILAAGIHDRVLWVLTQSSRPQVRVCSNKHSGQTWEKLVLHCQVVLCSESNMSITADWGSFLADM